MAIAGEMVAAEVIDAEEFPEMARQFGVGPVPKTIINYKVDVTGAAPEGFILEKIIALQAP